MPKPPMRPRSTLPSDGSRVDRVVGLALVGRLAASVGVGVTQRLLRLRQNAVAGPSPSVETPHTSRQENVEAGGSGRGPRAVVTSAPIDSSACPAPEPAICSCSRPSFLPPWVAIRLRNMWRVRLLPTVPQVPSLAASFISHWPTTPAASSVSATPFLRAFVCSSSPSPLGPASINRTEKTGFYVSCF